MVVFIQLHYKIFGWSMYIFLEASLTVMPPRSLLTQGDALGASLDLLKCSFKKALKTIYTKLKYFEFQVRGKYIYKITLKHFK